MVGWLIYLFYGSVYSRLGFCLICLCCVSVAIERLVSVCTVAIRSISEMFLRMTNVFLSQYYMPHSPYLFGDFLFWSSDYLDKMCFVNQRMKENYCDHSSCPQLIIRFYLTLYIACSPLTPTTYMSSLSTSI